MEKSRWFYVLLIALAFSGLCNAVSLLVLDRTIHYRDHIRHIEKIFPNKGLQIVSSDLISTLDGPPIGAFIGGSLVRYWLLPSDFPHLIINWGGIEEKCTTTLRRFDNTVIAARSDFVIINAGFCGLVTAVRSGGSLPDILGSNILCLDKMVETAQAHHVLPILSTLSPVRPRFLFSHLKIVDYSWAHKAAENAAINQFNSLIQKLSQAKDIPLIDFHKALSDPQGQLHRRFAISDGEHLNHDGYAFLTQFLEKELSRIFSANRPEFNSTLQKKTG